MHVRIGARVVQIGVAVVCLTSSRYSPHERVLKYQREPQNTKKIEDVEPRASGGFRWRPQKHNLTPNKTGHNNYGNCRVKFKKPETAEE